MIWQNRDDQTEEYQAFELNFISIFISKIV